MRSGGADYRDEDRLEHMMCAVKRIRAKMVGLDLPKLEMALKPIVDVLPQSPGAPENLNDFL